MSALEYEIANEDEVGSSCIRCGDDIEEGDRICWRLAFPGSPDEMQRRMVGVMHLDCAAAEDNPRREPSGG